MVKPETSVSAPTSGGSPPAVAANEIALMEAGEFGGSVGELLRVSREKAGMSLGDVASRLRMGVKQVRALEHDEYFALPTGTFLRGFVRNFAKEVGLKPEHALGLLEKTHQAAAPIRASAVVVPSQQNISVPAPGGEFATPRARIFVAVTIAALLLIVVWWWWEYVRPYRAEGGRPKSVAEEKGVSEPIALPAPTVNSTLPETAAAPLPELEQQAPVPAPVATNLPTSAPLTSSASTPAVATPMSADPVPPPVAPPSPRAIVAVDNGLLGLTFSDRSWVQVVDSTGKAVLDRTFNAGETQEVAGRAPFTVVIGNAKATRIAFNGKEVDLAPHTRASVARLTVK